MPTQIEDALVAPFNAVDPQAAGRLIGFPTVLRKQNPYRDQMQNVMCDVPCYNCASQKKHMQEIQKEEPFVRCYC